MCRLRLPRRAPRNVASDLPIIWELLAQLSLFPSAIGQAIYLRNRLLSYGCRVRAGTRGRASDDGTWARRSVEVLPVQNKAPYHGCVLKSREFSLESSSAEN